MKTATPMLACAQASPAKQKRKPNAAKALLKSSMSFMIHDMDTHNKVKEPYRYEKVAPAIITAWEKAKKSHLHNKSKIEGLGQEVIGSKSITFPTK